MKLSSKRTIFRCKAINCIWISTLFSCPKVSFSSMYTIFTVSSIKSSRFYISIPTCIKHCVLIVHILQWFVNARTCQNIITLLHSKLNQCYLKSTNYSSQKDICFLLWQPRQHLAYLGSMHFPVPWANRHSSSVNSPLLTLHPHVSGQHCSIIFW